MEKPTLPTSVHNRTPLHRLNLNWHERDLRERERTKHVHRLHPYLGKFIPQLAEIFLRKYFSEGQTVIDPFSGSGTTLVQAQELGIHSVGCDISAFNVLLSRAKTARYNVRRLEGEVTDILEKMKAPPPPSGTENAFLKKWFAPQALEELLFFRSLIPHYEHQDLLKIILSRSARSARLTTHFDLDFPKTPQVQPYHCFKHQRICEPTGEALKFLRRYAMDTLKRVAEFSNLRTGARVSVLHGDSRHEKFQRADGVITSPPYVGLIDYHQQHEYAFQLLGLEGRKSHEIGTSASGSGKKARADYQQSIASVFRRVAKTLRSGAPVIVVAADRHGLYDEIRKLAGLEEDDILRRQVNRRTGRRAGAFYESVFIWRRP